MQKFQCQENLPLVSDAALVLVFVKESYLGVLEFGLGESASTPSLYSPNLLMKFSLYFHPWMEAKGQQHKFIMLSLCVHASILLCFFFFYLIPTYYLEIFLKHVIFSKLVLIFWVAFTTNSYQREGSLPSCLQLFSLVTAYKFMDLIIGNKNFQVSPLQNFWQLGQWFLMLNSCICLPISSILFRFFLSQNKILLIFGQTQMDGATNLAIFLLIIFIQGSQFCTQSHFSLVKRTKCFYIK